MNASPREVVIPSSMEFFTPLVPLLLEKNPRLAQDVINCLNVIDRSRNLLWRQVFGERGTYGQ